MSDEPTCDMEVIITHDPLVTERCGKPAPTHGVTMAHDGVSLGRKPICDDHYEALKATQPSADTANGQGGGGC